MFLSIYIGVPMAAKPEIDFAGEVCSKLGCDALCAGDDPSPYRWLLIQPDLPSSGVLLRDEPYDERGEAVLCDPR